MFFFPSPFELCFLETRKKPKLLKTNHSKRSNGNVPNRRLEAKTMEFRSWLVLISSKGEYNMFAICRCNAEYKITNRTCFLFPARICFHCDSRNEVCSEDSVNGTSSTTCSEGNDFCVVVKDGRHEETRFYRDCINECDKELVDWSKDGEEYCKMCCDKDYCNVGRCSSCVLTPSYVFFVLSAIVAFRIMIVLA